MVRHRCTRCKEDVGEHGIRHKYYGGVFCGSCIRIIRGFHPAGIRQGFFGRLWDRIRDFVVAPFKPKPKSAIRDGAMRVAYSVMKSKARDIPLDAQTGSPQKR